MKKRGSIKPGYIILILASIAAIYIPYSIGKQKEQQRKEAIKRIYSYGDRILHYIKDKDSIKLQNDILLNGKEVDLEDVALFLDTISLDTIEGSKWEGYSIKENNITIHGKIKDTISPKRVDMMLIKKGDRLLLKAIHIGNSKLVSTQKEFPLNDRELTALGISELNETVINN